jgi:hypothetical protein
LKLIRADGAYAHIIEFEHTVSCSEAMIYIASMRRMLKIAQLNLRNILLVSILKIGEVHFLYSKTYGF